MRNLILTIFGLCFLLACSNQPKEWAFEQSIELGDIAPLGMAIDNGQLWLSDSDANLVVRLEDGKVVERLEGFDRPMHIASDSGTIYVPEYGIDTITVIKNGERTALSIADSLDAPAGVDVNGDAIAIADFYNNRIVYFDGKTWTSMGKKGHGEGELYYPTDVQIVGSQIFVADAYNNRVQVFDKEGAFLKMIGVEEAMNAATGIYVSTEEIFVTDFENDRVLVYDLTGKLLQTIEGDLNKPTDVVLYNGKLCIANYKAKRLDFYKK